MTSDRQVEPPQGRLRLYLVVALLLASVVSWRKGVYFSGALDPVVAAKAALGVLALATAAFAVNRSSGSRPVPSRTLVLALIYVIVTVIGGWTDGSLLASAVVALRVMMVLTTLALLVSAYPVKAILHAVIVVFVATAALAFATGIGSLSAGRLAGGLPPLGPNEIAALAGAGLIYVLAGVVNNLDHWWSWPTIIATLAVVYLTGSRTGLLVLIVVVVLMIAQMRRFPAGVFVGLALSVPLLVYVLAGTSLVSSVVARGGAENVATLSSRTIAWSAAFDMSGPWFQMWFGGGLAMKQIPVSGQYWSTQILDSSWVSAMVQGGYVGLLIVATWTLVVGLGCWRAPRGQRPLLLGLFLYVVGRSPLESGLFDATTSFIIFALLSFAVQMVPDEPVPLSTETGAEDPRTVDGGDTGAGLRGPEIDTVRRREMDSFLGSRAETVPAVSLAKR